MNSSFNTAGTPRKVGIMGGSFNPVHLAHCEMAECFVKETGADVCYFVPSSSSPLKGNDEYASDEHRLAMVQLAIGINPLFKVSDVEIERGGVSYTIDTVLWFRMQFPDSSMYLLIGEDQAAEFTRWKQWENILDTVQLCIVHRNDVNNNAAITKILTRGTKPPLWINCPVMNISSTEIRRCIQTGEPADIFLSNEVKEYIFEHGLYR